MPAEAAGASSDAGSGSARQSSAIGTSAVDTGALGSSALGSRTHGLRPIVRTRWRRRGTGNVWLFDLDNTLHDALTHIMPRINRGMTDFVTEQLGVTPEEADLLRKRYWHRYGATLLGLMRHHEVDPHHFLRDTHRFPDMDSLVRRDSRLVQMMRRLSGRRIVLTNAPRAYAEAVVARLGIAPFIDGLISIEDMRFAGRWQPKPSLASLERLVGGRLRARPASCTLVEDSPANLYSARRLRMRTVLVTGWAWPASTGRRPLAGRSSRVDNQIQSVLTLTRTALR